MYEKPFFLAIVLYGAIIPPFSTNPLQTGTCGPNEVYSDCVDACNDCQTRGIPCSFFVCNEGCDCIPGYTRNDQRMCIPENQCPSGNRRTRRTPYDYNEPDLDYIPETELQKFPPGVRAPQENPKENGVFDKTDKNFNKPLDKEDYDGFGINDKELGPPLDEDKRIFEDGDEFEIEDAGPEESEEDKKNKEHKPEKEKPDEERREEEENQAKPDEKKKEDEDQEKPYEEEEEELDEEKPDEEEREEEENEEKPDEEEREEEENEEKSNEEKQKEKDQEKPDEEKKELDEEKPDEERKEVENEERPDEDRKVEEEEIEEKHELENDIDKKHVTEEKPIDDDNEEEKIPEEVDEETDENDSKNKDGIPQEGDADFFKGGSIFDTPFFNLEKVKKYFSNLDRALGHVFRQTIDEALLLNGTYANTTEEEVDIDGKKYIITKSVIKGADNHSSMYIESLSAKPKMNDTEGMKDIEVKNLTQA